MTNKVLRVWAWDPWTSVALLAFGGVVALGGPILGRLVTTLGPFVYVACVWLLFPWRELRWPSPEPVALGWLTHVLLVITAMGVCAAWPLTGTWTLATTSVLAAIGVRTVFVVRPASLLVQYRVFGIPWPIPRLCLSRYGSVRAGSSSWWDDEPPSWGVELKSDVRTELTVLLGTRAQEARVVDALRRALLSIPTSG